MTGRSDFLSHLTRQLAQRQSAEPLSLRLCHALVDVIDASDGAIALSISSTRRTVICATSDRARHFEDAQDLVGQGPCLDVLRSGKAVSIDRWPDQRVRWPSLTQALGDLPVHALDAVPMKPAASMVGVLSVHRQTEPASTTSLGDLQFFADCIGAAVVNDVTQKDTSAMRWTDRDRVSQATGMVIEQLGVPAPDALALLRARAFAEDSTLVQVSHRVVTRQVDFHPDEDTP